MSELLPMFIHKLWYSVCIIGIVRLNQIKRRDEIGSETS